MITKNVRIKNVHCKYSKLKKVILKRQFYLINRLKLEIKSNLWPLEIRNLEIIYIQSIRT